MASSSSTSCDPNVETCLTRLQSVGLAMVAEAGFISLVSLLILFSLILRNIIRYYRHAPGKWSLIREPADAYVLSLFVADLLQSIGAFMDVRWVHRGSVEIGRFCTAQGSIQQLGETAVAMATIVIALHTFVAIWIRKGAHNLKVACGRRVIAVSWLFVILFVAIAASTKNNYYNPTPLWCWIGGQNKALRLAGEYVWLWLALFISISVYVPLFLWSRGYIAVDEERWWKVSLHWRVQSEKDLGSSTRARPDAPSLAILSYPFAYSFVILPVSVVRWASFQNHPVPDAATFFSVFLHDMFGCVNVLLLLTTKPNLLLFEDPRRVARGRFAQGGQGRAPGESPSRSPDRYGFDSDPLKPGSPGMEPRTQVRGVPPSPSLYGDRSENGDDHLGANAAARV